VIGIDIGKEVFHVVAFSVDGKIAFRGKIRRLGLKAVRAAARLEGPLSVELPSGTPLL
jgi:hypothetical protein